MLIQHIKQHERGLQTNHRQQAIQAHMHTDVSKTSVCQTLWCQFA